MITLFTLDKKYQSDIENNLKFSKTVLHICHVGVLIRKPLVGTSLKET